MYDLCKYIQLDGVNDFLQLNGVTYPETDLAFTYTSIFKVPTGVITTWVGGQYGGSAATRQWLVWAQESGGNVRLTFRIYDQTTFWTVSTAYIYNVDEYIIIGYSVDVANNNFYATVNGTAIDLSAWNANNNSFNSATTPNLQIGALNGSALFPSVFVMSTLHNVALSEAQLLALYNGVENFNNASLLYSSSCVARFDSNEAIWNTSFYEDNVITLNTNRTYNVAEDALISC